MSYISEEEYLETKQELEDEGDKKYYRLKDENVNEPILNSNVR